MIAPTLRASTRDLPGRIFQVALLASLLITLVVLFLLIADVIVRALPVFEARGFGLLSSPLSANAARAGVLQGLLGSGLLALIVAIVAFPLGIATAIYLEEYAGTGRFARFVQINIRNLAGVPSVVYGLLGLAIFVPLFGRSALAGGATLAVLVLPIVVITAVESLRSVPTTLREAGYGIGASPWQVTSRLVLPAAAPGILTGTVLALARALGETAPLIVAGAVLGSFSGTNIAKMVAGNYTALPVVIYDWSRRPQEAFRDNAAAAIVVLLVAVLAVNAAAIYLRAHFERGGRDR